MESIIKWQKGKPKEEGYYLITTIFGQVTFDYWMNKYIENGSYYYEWRLHCGPKEVCAWCKLSDINPYNEE